VHRIGRTARAGADGCAVSFVSAEERGLLRGIERMIKKSIPTENVEGFHSERAEKASGRGVPDELPRPAWADRKRGPRGRDEGRGQRRDRPGHQGRMQPDFRREPDSFGGGGEAPQREQPAGEKKWYKPFHKAGPEPQRGEPGH
jgi:ATP-dependent RNA helicase RhlE